MESKAKLKEFNSAILNNQTQDIKKRIDILNDKVKNYEKIIIKFKKDLKQLVLLYKEYHRYFNNNFRFRNEEVSRLVFMKKKLKNLIYTKKNKSEFFNKIKNYYIFSKKMLGDFDEIYECHEPSSAVANFKISQTGDSVKIKALWGLDFPFGEMKGLWFKHLITDKSHKHLQEKQYWFKEDFTEETVLFFNELIDLRSDHDGVLDYNGYDDFYVLSKDSMLEKIKPKLELSEKELRKRELILRGRKKGQEKMENVGYVYVLYNDAYPGAYKIGSTYDLPEKRAEELTGTGHLTPFKVVAKYKVQRAEYYEKKAHKLLKKYRVKKGREFFKLELNKIRDCLKQITAISENGKKKIQFSTLKNRVKF